jgi:type I restriction enzyme S subunit
MNAKRYQLGELCRMVKGISPTLKTPPGPYPLVVTADFRRTAATWQLEGPAVCIPLVSSTGHGDAALHRVHYQDGKFALANLLVALLPKNPSVCAAKYLYYLLLTGRDELLVPLMRGTANVSLKERDISGVEISLPSIEEQLRVVARIEGLAMQIQEAQALRRETIEEAKALLRSILAHDHQTKLTPLRELLRLRSPDVSVRVDALYEFAGVYSFGRGVFKAGRKSGMDFAYKRLTRVRAGEFVYPKLMAWEGALGVVPPECDGCVVSTEFPVFEVNRDRVLPEVLDVYFRTPSVWPEVSRSSTGTNVRRRRLNPHDFLAYEMPLPSWDTQLKLKAVYIEVSKLNRIHSETATELGALLPSVLSRTFAGEL